MAERSLLVKVGAELTALEKAFTLACTKVQTLGKAISKAGTELTKTVTAPLAGIGAAAFKAAADVQDGLNKIRVGTGASAGAMEKFGEVYRNILGTIPATSEQIGSAIADVSTLLGYTGPQLEQTARQFLNLAKVTGSDVGPVIQSSAKLFAQWGVATKDQGALLDYLLRVTQSTGVPFLQLTDTLTQQRPVLRAWGADVYSGAALVGQMNLKGAETDKVFAAGSKALRKFAGDVEDDERDIAKATDQVTAAQDRAGQAAERLAGATERASSAENRAAELADRAAKAREAQQAAWDALARSQEDYGASCNAAAYWQNRLAAAQVTMGSIVGYNVKQSPTYIAALADAKDAERHLAKAQRDAATDGKEITTARAALERATAEVGRADVALADGARAVEKAHAGVAKAAEATAEAEGKAALAGQRLAKESATVGDVTVEFGRLFREIQAAPTDLDAYALGVKTFGKSAVQMVTAIRQGVFSVDDLQKACERQGDTAAKAAADTYTWRDRMQMLRGEVTKALEPLGVKLMQCLRDLTPAIRGTVDWIKALVEAFMRLPPATQVTIIKVAALAAVLGPMLIILGQVVAAVASLGKAAVAMRVALAACGGPIVSLFSTVAGSVGSLASVVFGGIGRLVVVIGQLFSSLGGVGGGISACIGWIARLGPYLLGLGRGLLALVGGPIGVAVLALTLIVFKWDWVKDWTIYLVGGLVSWLGKAWAWIRGATAAAWKAVAGAVVGSLQWVYDKGKAILSRIGQALAAAWKAMGDKTKIAWKGIVAFLKGAWVAIKEGAIAAFGALLRAIQTVWAAVGPIVTRLLGGPAEAGVPGEDLKPTLSALLASSLALEDTMGEIADSLGGLGGEGSDLGGALDLVAESLAELHDWLMTGTVPAGTIDLNSAMYALMAQGIGSLGQLVEDSDQMVGLLGEQRDLLAGLPAALAVAGAGTGIATALEAISAGQATGNEWLRKICSVAEQILATTTTALGVEAEVPALASGAIVRAPTLAMVGEAGPEAVVPLRGGRGRLGAGGIEVHVHVAGSIATRRDLAEQIRQELFRVQRHNGTTGLA